AVVVVVLAVVAIAGSSHRRALFTAVAVPVLVAAFGAVWIAWLCRMVSRNNPRTAVTLFVAMTAWWLWFVATTIRAKLEAERRRARSAPRRSTAAGRRDGDYPPSQ